MVSVKDALERVKSAAKRRDTLLVGLALAGTVATTSAEAHEANSPKKDNIEVKAPTRNTLDMSNVVLDDLKGKAPSCTYYAEWNEWGSMTDRDGNGATNYTKAYYQRWHDDGNGAIVVKQYHCSDEKAFELRAQSSKTGENAYGELPPATYEEAIARFATAAKNMGYTGKITNLKEAADCVKSYENVSKKQRWIKDRIDEEYDGSGLRAAQVVLNAVDNVNKGNLQSASHEEMHAELGELNRKIDVGDIVLSPGGNYLFRMADELRAWVKDGAYKADEAGMAAFHKEHGNSYSEKYSDELKDASYRRLQADELNEEIVTKKLNFVVSYDDISFYRRYSPTDDKGNDVSQSLKVVKSNALGLRAFFCDNKEAEHLVLTNGTLKWTIPFNCLIDDKDNVVTGEAVKGITVSPEKGTAVKTFEVEEYSTRQLDKTADMVIDKVLADLNESDRAGIKEALDKYYRSRAGEIDNNWIYSEKSNIDALRKEGKVSDEQRAYIKDKRRGIYIAGQ